MGNQTRIRSVSLATKAADAVSKMLTDKERKSLAVISKKIASSSERTELVGRLADLVKQGVAFHHAGLDQKCREAVEDGYRKKFIKLLSSTPTLAAGVNLPARRVVVSSVLRYNGKMAAPKFQYASSNTNSSAAGQADLSMMIMARR